ncbi:hypothetical protein [Streptomyces sp. ICBB 8177]|uniref:hypothetical protein n=1 Tax=Streptomyces sp. ICBB 8177 TaxID=563922 RepID=UPI000D67D65F|nr:hypothetical protein [Streptomyces sp. ICBB 8177]PWI45688.1 hypothetical protein CK485_00450 [Streptomyces sp. ICBB 8177]
MTTRIGQVIMLAHAGDREEARDRFAALWQELGEHGSPLHRCTLAHYMADTQDDPEDELDWDLRALRAAEAVEQDRVTWGEEELSIRGFYPSLHLNLAADYHRLDEPALARAHLDRALACADALGDDAYGDGIRAAISRLDLRLAVTGGGPGAEPGHLP